MATNLLHYFKKRWNHLAAAAVAIMATLSTFLLPPPSSVGGVSWFDFGRFLLAILVGLWLLPTFAWKEAHYAKRWWATALLFFLAGVVAFWGYASRLDAWRAPYPYPADTFESVVIGDALRPEAERYIRSREAEGQRTTAADLLMAAGGEADRIWYSEEVDERTRTLALLYLATVVLFGSTMIAVIQAGYCLSQPDSAPAPTRS